MLRARIAQRTLAKREAGYASEVRRLLDAGAARSCGRGGTASRPRVADIVAAAGLSNDAFYRHFPSKDALVAAHPRGRRASGWRSYLAHQMARSPTPEGQVRRWVEGVLAQTPTRRSRPPRSPCSGTAAASARASRPAGTRRERPARRPAPRAVRPLGSADPELDASLAAHAVVGKLSDYLWQRTTPAPAESTTSPPSASAPSPLADQGVVALPVALAQQALVELAVRVAGQLVDEVDGARALVGRPARPRQYASSSASSSGPAAAGSTGCTTAFTASPISASGTPITATSATAGWPASTFSASCG